MTSYCSAQKTSNSSATQKARDVGHTELVLKRARGVAPPIACCGERVDGSRSLEPICLKEAWQITARKTQNSNPGQL